jgi:hypothetical protein
MSEAATRAILAVASLLEVCAQPGISELAIETWLPIAVATALLSFSFLGRLSTHFDEFSNS